MILMNPMMKIAYRRNYLTLNMYMYVSCKITTFLTNYAKEDPVHSEG